MADLVYLNGEIVPSAEAKISPFDRGFLYGDGLFETMRSYGGRVHLLGRHLDRLEESAAVLNLSLPARPELERAVAATLEANHQLDAAIRLTVTRGVGGSAGSPETSSAATILVNLRPLLQSGIEETRKLTTISVVRQIPETGRRFKTLDMLHAVMAAPEIARAGADEGLMLSPDGYVAEGTVSNIFCVVDGLLWTPPLDLGILPGITRQWVIELAGECGIEIRVDRFFLEFLKGAAECFYTNSVREIVAVGEIDGAPIADGQVGIVTRRLSEAYRAAAPRED